MKELHRRDMLLLAALVAAGLAMFWVLRLTARAGAVVQVRVEGTVVAEYPLSRDGSYTISGYEGGTNLLVIQDGVACITEASCPDGLCIHTGKISSGGQSIICLPNRVVVEICAEEDGAELPDALTG